MRFKKNGRRFNKNRNGQNRGGNRQNGGQRLGQSKKNYEKYLGLAQDAASEGKWIEAESYYQHADHYLRMAGGLSAFQPQEDTSEASDTSDENAEAAEDKADESAKEADVQAEQPNDEKPKRKPRPKAKSDNQEKAASESKAEKSDDLPDFITAELSEDDKPEKTSPAIA